MAIWTSAEPVSPSCRACSTIIPVLRSFRRGMWSAWSFSLYLAVVVLAECSMRFRARTTSGLRRYLAQDRGDVGVLVGDATQLHRRARRKSDHFHPDALALYQLEHPAKVTVARKK